ncbi:hypothetical protein CSAL01_11314 [Colletotrichum salicis]|uniref:Activator of Hsp90 ATPase 1 family protein n=1 Tax=Colletotrichum salicis TaxID=1209931 RepID=A0A135U4R2_9PEZI|nr:hypothetical protein CSAL01_11314 [Colletotrichum salicis]
MGQTNSISAEIEIQAPPSAVRSVFLEFSEYNQWSQKWAFEPTEPGKDPSDLKDGDKIKVDMGGMAFSPVIMENTTETLQWVGSIPLLFTGKHEFWFNPSEQNSGGTKFIQVEEFRGLLAFLMAPRWGFRQKTLVGWNQFNEDLKKEVERRPC